MQVPVRIAVIGVGHRGLSVFERTLSYVLATGVPVEVHLVEPGELGVGIHRREQPDYLLLNTVAGQITAFSDERMVPDGPISTGLSFLEWCQGRAIRPPVVQGSCVSGDPAAAFFPRRVLGDYFAWAARDLLRRVPPCMTVSRLQAEAVWVRPSGKHAEVQLRDGRILIVDLAIVTTGHGRLTKPKSEDATLVSDVYPLPQSVAHVSAGDTVAIAGTGLSAVDVVASLTVGRGGRFHASSERLLYRRSGDEPNIVVFNRSGWLPCVRPAQPRTKPREDARFLTVGALDALRERSGDRRLDFSDLQELIRAEILADGLDPSDHARVSRVLRREPETFACGQAYGEAVVAQAKWDLAGGRAGLKNSLPKARLESLRDFREILRMTVDPPGLTAEGHRQFFAVVPGLANRAVVGPQLERLAEIVALLETGIVRLGPGPDPLVTRSEAGWVLKSRYLRKTESMSVDTLIHAHLPLPPGPRANDLVARIRSWAATHPIDDRYLGLTRDGYVRERGGGVCKSVAVFGAPAEGTSYYNNYLLWPGVWSRILNDIDRVLRPLLMHGSVC